MARHETRVENQLRRLDGFEDGIQANRDLIETCTHNARYTKNLVDAFRKEDVYTKSEECFKYFQLKLVEFRREFEEEVKPSIQRAVLDQASYTKRHLFQKLHDDHKHTKTHTHDLLRQVQELADQQGELAQRTLFIEETSRDVRHALGNGGDGELLPGYGVIQDL